jgi:integrase
MARKKNYRRLNGSGTVYRLSGNRRRPWVACVTKGWTDETEESKSKQIKHIIGYFEEHDEAMKALLDYVPSISEKVSEKTTIDEIFKIIVKECEKENRNKDYMNSLNASYYPLESLKNKSLYSLNYMDFQDIIDNLIDDPDAKSSHGKLTRIKGLIKRMYDELIKYKLLNVNYAQFISLRGIKPGKVTAFPEEDIDTLFKNDDDRIAKSSLILAYTGLRINEFLDLKKDKNIDLENGLIIGGGKTEKGTDRLIAIHSKVMPYIKYFYNEFPESKYLFTKDGEKVRYEYYREYYHQPLVERLKLNDYGVNSFRHTAASKMKMAGLDDKAIEDMMGHTDINFTKKQYVDINAKFLHEQMEKME